MKHLNLYEEFNPDQEKILLSALKKAYETLNVKMIDAIHNKNFIITEEYEREIVYHLCAKLSWDGLLLLNKKYQPMINHIKKYIINPDFKRFYSKDYPDSTYYGFSKNDLYYEISREPAETSLYFSHDRTYMLFNNVEFLKTIKLILDSYHNLNINTIAPAYRELYSLVYEK